MEFIIQYKVIPDKIDEVKAIVRKFVDGIRDDQDPGYSYKSSHLPDGLSFVHLAWFEDDAALDRFKSRPHFKEFAGKLGDFCESKPVNQTLTTVASSR